MNRYEYCDNPVEGLLEDLHDGFVHEGSWVRKLFTRPCILFVSIILGCLAAAVSGHAGAWFVDACMQYLPAMHNPPIILAVPLMFFAVGTPIGAIIVSFSLVRQYAYMALRRRAGDPCDNRVIIPVRILSESCV